jgi:hypothetical protein
MSSQVRVGLFWRFAFGVGAIAAPVVAYAVTALVADGRAREEYFEAVAQILPVLLLALAIEQRYFTRAGRERAPESPVQLELAGRQLVDEQRMARWYTLAARIYALVVLALLGDGRVDLGRSPRHRRIDHRRPEEHRRLPRRRLHGADRYGPRRDETRTGSLAIGELTRL